MGSQPGSAQLPPDPQQVDAGRCHGQYEALDAGSYTAQQLVRSQTKYMFDTISDPMTAPCFCGALA